MNTDLHLINPHLEGGPFFWEGGPTGVVLSHGFTATSAEVRRLGRILHEAGCTVAGPLLPGHGTRPADLNRSSWQSWVEALEHSLQHTLEFCQKVFIGGVSTGGLLALYLAADYPQICGVLTYAPALRLQVKLRSRIFLYLASPLIPSVPKPDRGSSPYWQGYRVNPLKATIQLLKLQNEVMRRLPSVHQPVLVIQGRLDATVHSSVPDLIQARSGGPVEIHWMEKSTHGVILEDELDAVASLSLDFLKHNSR